MTKCASCCPSTCSGTLEGPEDLEVRRHLRGCAGCRTDMTALSEGVVWFAHAAHDRSRRPDELHDRVMTTLDQEWGDAPAERSDPGRMRWIGRAAAVVAIAADARLGPVPGASGERDRRGCAELPQRALHARRQGVPGRHARLARRASDRGQRGAVRLRRGAVLGHRARPRARASPARPPSTLSSSDGTASGTRPSTPGRSSSSRTATPRPGWSRRATSRRSTT